MRFNHPQIERVEAESAEDQLNLFSRHSGIWLASIARGSDVFLAEFGRWFSGATAGKETSTKIQVVLSPEPSHSLAFPTTLDALRCAQTFAENKIGASLDLHDTINQYGLTMDLCNQPIFTLSGGERVMACLAKSSLILPHADHLVMCNPSRWLHPPRRHLVKDTIDFLNRRNGTGVFISVRGEEDHAPAPIDCAQQIHSKFSNLASHQWTIRFSHQPPVTVRFPPITFPTSVPSKTISYFCGSNSLTLDSPTLVTGDNGVGKTTFAKVLAGIVSLDAGEIGARCAGFSASPRYLFQENTRQLFGMSPLAHLHNVYQFDQARLKSAMALFENLQSDTYEMAKSIDPEAQIGSDTIPTSLVQARLMLAAERLVSGAKMLLLDEPSWGLTKALAIGYIYAVVAAASERAIAIAVISHDTNLPPGIFRSRLNFSAEVGRNRVMVAKEASRE